MGFFDHIEELRIRLMRAILAVGVGMCIGFVFTNPVLNIIKDTYGSQLTILDPTDSIVVFFRVSLLLGAILASPLITYQIFMFIVPGLTSKEKRSILLALPATTVLFLVGIIFTWVFLVPAYVNFLKGFQSDVFKVNYTADAYVSFITAVLFWHGAAFETPLVFYVLGKLGVVNARTMLKYWRHAVVGASIIAAFITPTVDPLTMIVITIMLVALYALSVVLVAVTNSTGRRLETSVVGQNGQSSTLRRNYWLRLFLTLVIVLGLVVVTVPIAVGGTAMWRLLHPACWTDDRTPATYGLKYQDISIPSQAGTLKGYFIPGSKDATIIVPTPYNTGRMGMLYEGSMLASGGFNILTYETRLCAGKGVTTLGYSEADDLGDALAYLRQNSDNIHVNLNHIAVHGFSAAGAAALLATARYPEIAAVLAEGGYDDADQELGFQQSSGFFDSLMIFGARATYRLVTGADVSVLRPVEAIRHIPPRPIYLVYGSQEVSLPGARDELAAARSASTNPSN